MTPSFYDTEKASLLEKIEEERQCIERITQQKNFYIASLNQKLALLESNPHLSIRNRIAYLVETLCVKCGLKGMGGPSTHIEDDILKLIDELIERRVHEFS